LIAAGVLIGSSASLALTRLIQSVLWGVKPTDPLTFISVVSALFAIGLAASDVPARRALSVDPVIALRSE
jgi:ABC-type antimicrobial peptide transport system permease subunit